jgi:hypothetical protein
VSLWDNAEDEQQQRTQRIIIIAAAVAAVLLIFWVFRNAIAIASRPGDGGGFAGSGRARQLINGIDTEGGTPPPQITRAPNPGSPLSSPSRSVAPAPAPPAYIPPPPPPFVGGAYAPPPNVAPTLPDLYPEERAAAKAATGPLRQTLAAVHDYDRRSFWNNDSPEISTDRRADEAANASDALGTMVGLFGHPDRFPVPMRGNVAIAASGIRGYLRVTREAAVTSDPVERQRMRPDALKRLADADAAVSRLEGVNPNNGFATGRSAN